MPLLNFMVLCFYENSLSITEEHITTAFKLRRDQHSGGRNKLLEKHAIGPSAARLR